MATITQYDNFVFNEPPIIDYEQQPTLSSVIAQCEGWWRDHSEAADHQSGKTVLLLWGKISTLTVQLSIHSLQEGMQEKRDSYITEYDLLKNNAAIVASFSEILEEANSYTLALLNESKPLATPLELAISIDEVAVSAIPTESEDSISRFLEQQQRISSLMKEVSLTNGLYQINLIRIKESLEDLCYKLDHGKSPPPGAILTIAPYDPNKIIAEESHVVESTGWGCCGFLYSRAAREEK